MNTAICPQPGWLRSGLVRPPHREPEHRFV